MTPTASQSQAARPMLRSLKSLADAQSTLPARRTAQLAGGPMEYVLAGEGEPTVVLIGGIGVPIDAWALVLPEVARTCTVVAFNRRGSGTPPEARPQTGSAVVDVLRELLAAAGAPVPYVLVGHAVGGLYANLFARQFPQEVAGVVLLEPTHPADELHERRLRFLPPARRASGARRPDEQQFLRETGAEIERAGPFPDVPLIVVSGSKTPPRWAMSPERIRTHAARQLELARLAALGRHTVAPASGHFPQVTDPAIVVRAVRDVAGA